MIFPKFKIFIYIRALFVIFKIDDVIQIFKNSTIISIIASSTIARNANINSQNC